MSEYNERFVFELLRTHSDGSEEIISIEVNGEAVTHFTLGEKFNAFLSSCGYIGHNYINEK